MGKEIQSRNVMLEYYNADLKSFTSVPSMLPLKRQPVIGSKANTDVEYSEISPPGIATQF